MPLDEERYFIPRKGISIKNDLYVGFKLYKLFNFDHSSQAYEADLKLFFEYNDLNYTGNGDYESLESEALWKPQFYVANSIGKPIHITRTIEYKKDKERKIKINYRVQVKLHAVFDFVNFPFDVQEICIAIGFPRFRSHINSLNLIEERNSGKVVIGGDLVEGMGNDIQLGMDDFSLVRCYGTIRKAAYFLTKDRDKTEYHIKVYLKRRYAYWIKLVYYPLLSFSLSALIIFCFPLDHVEQRSDCLLTLLLTNVAIRISLADKLPRIAYLTALDNVLRNSSIFLFTLLLYSITVYRTSSVYMDQEKQFVKAEYKDNFETIEIITFVLYGLWILYQIMNVRRRVDQQQIKAAKILLNKVNTTDIGLKAADPSMDSIRDNPNQNNNYLEAGSGEIVNLFRNRVSLRIAEKKAADLKRPKKRNDQHSSCKTPRN